MSAALQAVPPHRQLRDFLGPDLVGRLLAHAAARQADFEPTRLVGGVIDPAFRSSRLLRDLGGLRGALEAAFAGVQDEAVRALGLSPIDLVKLELELVAHGDGAFYRTHIDTATERPDAASVRALTAVYYFHRQPQGFSGGALRLQAIAPGADGRRAALDIDPDNDTLLLFPSWVPHEVRPVRCPSGDFLDSRFAINCWYRHRRAG